MLTSEDISNWKGNDGVATSILSANSHDSQGSKTLKQVGFFISILFLTFTMVIVMKERDSRRTGAVSNKLHNFQRKYDVMDIQIFISDSPMTR